MEVDDLESTQTKKRNLEYSSVTNKRLKTQLRSPTLSTSKKTRKRKRSQDQDIEMTGTARKKRMGAFENGAGKSVEDLEKQIDGLHLEDMVIEDRKEQIVTVSEPSLAIIPLNQPKQLKFLNPKALDMHGVGKMAVRQFSTTSMKISSFGGELSAEVLKLLCSLGFIEKTTCFGEDMYVILKEKFVPILSKPTSYYFSSEKLEKIHFSNAQACIKTLVGLWILLVKLGYFIPFPEVEKIFRMFSPEVNHKRLRNLGSAWLRQLGLDSKDFVDPRMMDLICKKIVQSLRQGQKAVKDHAEPVVEAMEVS